MKQRASRFCFFIIFFGCSESEAVLRIAGGKKVGGFFCCFFFCFFWQKKMREMDICLLSRDSASMFLFDRSLGEVSSVLFLFFVAHVKQLR